VGSVDRLFARAFFARAHAREQGLAVLLDGPIFSAASGEKKRKARSRRSLRIQILATRISFLLQESKWNSKFRLRSKLASVYGDVAIC